MAAGLVAVLAVPTVVRAQGTPLTLERAIEVAVQRSREVRDAQLELERARGQVREAWGSVMPTLDLNASYTRNLQVQESFLPAIFFDTMAGPDDLMKVRFGSDNMWNFQLRAEQPLFQASAIIGVGAATRYEALREEMVRGRTQSVVTRVRVAYYDALLAEEGARLTENTVRRIRQTLDEMKKMEKAGVASNYDVLRLEVELANVEPALRRAVNRAKAARRALAVELGLEELENVEIAGSLAQLNVDSLHGAAVPLPASVDAALEQARERRTELRQLELTEALREAEMRVEQSEYLPRVSLFGTYSINAQQSGNPVFFGDARQRAFGEQVGVQVTMPLFNGFKRPARIAQRRFAVEQVRTQRDLAEDQIEHQVRTFVDEVEEAKQRATAQRLGVRQAERGFQIATVQFREGLGSALELTDAEVALRQSEFNYAEAVYDYLVARARLEDAMGSVDFRGHAGGGVLPEVRR